MYELISTPTNASGTMTKDTIEVIYYYKLKATSVLVHHYKENTTEQLEEITMKKVLAVLKRTGIGKFRMKYRDLELDKEKCVVLMKGQEIHLTSTEYKLLLYLMENRGRVVTKAMLLEQLWDIDGNFVDDNTVRVNIKRLRQKLNDEKQEYIVTVFGMGYSFGE